MLFNMDVISSFIAFSDFNSMFLSRTEERDTRNVLKDMRSNSRNERENRKNAIISTRRLTTTKPGSNHPRLAAWKA